MCFFFFPREINLRNSACGEEKASGDKKISHRGGNTLWEKTMRNIEGSGIILLDEIVGDLVTIVGGGLIPAARPLRKKNGEKGVKKKYFRFQCWCLRSGLKYIYIKYIYIK